MKFNKIMQISIHRAIRNKKRNLIVTIPIIFIMTFLLIINIIQYSMKEYIKQIEDNIELRTIDGINYTEAQYDQIIEKLQNIEHIEMIVDMQERQIYADQYCEQLKTENTNGYICTEPINSKTCPEVIKGRKIEEEDKNAIVIPSKIYANGTTSYEFDTVVLKKQNKEEMYVKGEDLLGKTITIELQKNNRDNIKKTFEVIGIYDSDRYYNADTLYISKSTIKEINRELESKTVDTFIKIIVDKIDNLKEVENKIYLEGLKDNTQIQEEAKKDKKISNIEEQNIAVVTNLQVETQDIIKKLILCFWCASILIFLSLLITTNMNKTYLSETEIGILKTEGYTNKEIQKITTIENIIVSIIGIIISFIIFGIIMMFGNALINYLIEKDTLSIKMNEIRRQLYYISKIPQKINWIFAFISSIVIIIIETMNTYFTNKKILSKNIKELLAKD